MIAGTSAVVGEVEPFRHMALGPPKSAAGKRTVAIPDPVVPVLREHIREFSEKGAGGRVFVGAKGATLRRTNFQAMWRKGVKKAGLPPVFRFHDLRHTGNTWAAGSGANLRELMERMGHSSTRAALIYLHGSRSGDRRIADGIGRQMAGGDGDDQGDEDDDGGPLGRQLGRDLARRPISCSVPPLWPGLRRSSDLVWSG
jgi:Phage integrase family